MKALLLAILRIIFGPKLMAALQGGQAAYEAEEKKEAAQAVAAAAAAVQQIKVRVATDLEVAHAQVVSAVDPDAVVNEQLRGLGIVAEDGRSAGGDACATSAPVAAKRKNRGG